MRTNKDKAMFINDVMDKIERRMAIVTFFNEVCVPFMDKYDGKVMNKRFTNQLKELAQKQDERMWIEPMEGGFTIHMKKDKFNYTDNASFPVKMTINDDGRLSMERTRANSLWTAWYENFNADTETMRETIKKYDEYMAVADKMKEAVDAYNHLPWVFRMNIDKWGVNIF